MTAQPVNSTEQQALNAIEAQYQQAMVYIQAMQNDTARITQDEAQLKWYKELASIFLFGDFSTQINALEADENAAKADLTTQGDKLTALDPEFQSLCDSLTALINTIDSAVNDNGTGIDQVMDDINKIAPALNKILDAMKQKLQSDMYLAEIRSGGDLSNQELAALATQAVGYMSAEAGDLSQCSSDLQDLFTQFQAAYKSAHADLESYDFWDDVASFFGGDAEENKARDRAIMANATDMMNGLETVLHALGPEVARMMPAFTQVINVIQQIMKEVKEILQNVNLTGAEKNGAILALVMFLLTFFQVVKQDVESEKAKNNQDMSKGTILASQYNIDDTMTNQKIKEEMEHNAAVMKVVMIVSEVVLGAIMMACAPGVGTAFMVGLVTAFEVMQTEGVVNVTAALGDAFHSQIGADIFVAGLECIMTMGGGALLDQAAASATKELIETAADAALQAAKETIEKAAQEAAEAAAKSAAALAAAGGDAAQAVEKALPGAMKTMSSVAQKAAQKAAEGAVAQFMKQPFATLVKMLGSVAKEAAAAAEKAAQEAIATAVEDAATIAKLAGRGIEASEEIVDGIATKAANEAVASASGKSVSSVTKEADLVEKPWRTAAIRGAWTLLFSVGNTNMLVDIAKKAGAKDDDVLVMILGMIQQLIQMIAMMAGSGMMAGSTFEGVASGFPRVANWLTLFPQAAQAGSAYSNYQSYTVESKAVTALSMNGSVADMLHSFLEQLQKDGNLDREIMTKAIESWNEGTQSLAGHLQDGDQAAIQVLVSAV